MINTNNAAPLFHHIRPVQEAAPPHAVIQIAPEAGAPQENAHPHPANALQNKRPAWANQITDSLSNKGAQLTGTVKNALNSLKNNPKPLLYMAAAEALLLMSNHMLSDNHHVGHQDRGRNLRGTIPVTGGSTGGAAGHPITGGSGQTSKKTTALVGVGLGIALLLMTLACYWDRRCRGRNITDPRDTANRDFPVQQTNRWGFVQQPPRDGASLGAAVSDVRHDNLPTSSAIPLSEIPTTVLASLPVGLSPQEFESFAVDALSQLPVDDNGKISTEKAEEQLSNIQNPQDQARAIQLWQKALKLLQENQDVRIASEDKFLKSKEDIASTSSS